jgi:two-component system response regulator AtoC
VREGGFRQDIFYRLNVVHIKTPPLRERKGDIPHLVDHFLNKYCALLKREPLHIPATTMEFLQAYHWPGNVRQIENLVRRAIVLQNWEFLKLELRPQEVCGPSDLRPPTSDPRLHDPVTQYFQNGVCSLREITNSYVSEVERRSILDALKSVQWNRRKAAQILGVSYKTLCNRIKELGIQQGG